MNGFFMASDLMALRDASDLFSYRGRRLGSVAGWAVQLIQEQGSYHDEDKAWIEAPAHLELHEVDEWAGLGREGLAGGERTALDVLLGNALLAPSFLHGRMRGIGPDAAAAVLRRCADGMAPQQTWALAAQELRRSRLRELADVLEKVPHATSAAWGWRRPSCWG